MGLAAVGHYKVVGRLSAGDLFMASDRFGKGFRKLRQAVFSKPNAPPEPVPFKILQS
jgi:hypothetical protein